MFCYINGIFNHGLHGRDFCFKRLSACKCRSSPKPPPKDHKKNPFQGNLEEKSPLQKLMKLGCRCPKKTAKEQWFSTNQHIILALALELDRPMKVVSDFLYMLTLQNFREIMNPLGTPANCHNVPLAYSNACEEYFGIFDTDGNVRSCFSQDTLQLLMRVIKTWLREGAHREGKPFKTCFGDPRCILGPRRNRKARKRVGLAWDSIARQNGKRRLRDSDARAHLIRNYLIDPNRRGFPGCILCRNPLIDPTISGHPGYAFGLHFEPGKCNDSSGIDPDSIARKSRQSDGIPPLEPTICSDNSNAFRIHLHYAPGEWNQSYTRKPNGIDPDVIAREWGRRRKIKTDGTTRLNRSRLIYSYRSWNPGHTFGLLFGCAEWNDSVGCKCGNGRSDRWDVRAHYSPSRLVYPQNCDPGYAFGPNFAPGERSDYTAMYPNGRDYYRRGAAGMNNTHGNDSSAKKPDGRSYDSNSRTGRPRELSSLQGISTVGGDPGPDLDNDHQDALAAARSRRLEAMLTQLNKKTHLTSDVDKLIQAIKHVNIEEQGRNLTKSSVDTKAAESIADSYYDKINDSASKSEKQKHPLHKAPKHSPHDGQTNHVANTGHPRKEPKKLTEDLSTTKIDHSGKYYYGAQMPVLTHEPYNEDKPWTYMRRHPHQQRMNDKDQIVADKNVHRYRRQTVNLQMTKARAQGSVASVFSTDSTRESTREIIKVPDKKPAQRRP